MKHLKALFAIALVAFFAAPAFAETQNVKVSGSMDAYWFFRSNFDLLDNNDAGNIPASSAVPSASHTGSLTNRSEADSFFMSITQVQVAADLTDKVSTVINVVNQRDWNADTYGTSTGAGANNTSNEFDIDLDLAYVQMKEIFYSPLTLTVGRQDIVFGRGFIVGWNPQDPENSIEAEEFTALQAFDAVRATLDFAPWTLDFVYANLVENSHNAEDDSDMWIANINYKFAEYNAVAEGYIVSQLDRATLSTVSNSGTQLNATHTLGGRAQFDPISQITLGGELAYQFGSYHTTSNGRDRDAWGMDLFGEYRWDNSWKPMVGLEYVLLSGEENLSSSTSDNYGAWNGGLRGPIYGWIRDYQNTYYQLSQSSAQVAGQNQQHISVYATMQPMEDLKLGVNYFYFWSDVDAHTTTSNPNSAVLSDDIGHEIDLSLTYDYTEDVSFIAMVDWFIPGDYFVSPEDATATQVVTGVKVGF